MGIGNHVILLSLLETAEQKLKTTQEVDKSVTLTENQDTENKCKESKTENTESEPKHKSKPKKGKNKSSSEKNDLPTEKVLQRAADIVEMLKE